MCVSPQRRAFFRHRSFKKWSRTQFFNTLTSKCAFSPQRRAFFRHLNFKKCSRNDVFCTFSLPSVLFATAACIFSTSKLQKVLRHRQFFSIFTSKSAFRHSGVQFFISPLSSYLRTRRFNRPTFGLTRHTNHWKTQHFATSLTFGADVSSFFWLSRYCIFFLPTWLPVSSAFPLSILSEVCYLNFLRLYPWVVKRDSAYICRLFEQFFSEHLVPVHSMTLWLWGLGIRRLGSESSRLIVWHCRELVLRWLAWHNSQLFQRWRKAGPTCMFNKHGAFTLYNVFMCLLIGPDATRGIVDSRQPWPWSDCCQWDPQRR